MALSLPRENRGRAGKSDCDGRQIGEDSRGIDLNRLLPARDYVMRIAIAGIMHESNTFNPLPTDLPAFHEQGLSFGADLYREWRDAHHEVGGFLASANRLGFEPVPLMMAWATPSGPVTRRAFDELTGRLIERFRTERPDGLLLA